MSDQFEKLSVELSTYNQQLEDDTLTLEKRSDILKKIRHIKIRLFLNGVEEEGNDT